MWKCPICSNVNDSQNICTECDYDQRNDFIKNRTLNYVQSNDVKARARLMKNINIQNTLNEILINFDDLSKKYEILKNEVEMLKKEILNQKPNSSLHIAQPTQNKKIFPDGSWYEGDLVNGMCNGYGIFNYANGTKYEGEFLNGHRHGEGKCYFSNGTILEGKWEHDEIVYGKEIYVHGNCYEGYFKKGKHHGKGVFHYANGDRYEGMFAEGVCHGLGTYYYANKTHKKGTWKNGIFIISQLCQTE